ncbi:hypothetical protein [Agaribacter marinus]|uniref:Rap1a immunity protein domain-containing protein n=1 Tax=Agaribacter marinus TaxID=1431249 RepID=A0AA37WMB4_9ALTE|nr:hypothetical protein [Agaribacter marinus]GLR72650.1 hypothetical protein GCM10007852_35580 [Agaribacter marinus]
MKFIKFVSMFLVLVLSLVKLHIANAIDVSQLAVICSASDTAQRQFCHTYLGGALDAIAVMNDHAKANGQPIYCVHESALFDMEKIKAYVISQEAKFAKKNAILPVVELLKVTGGCLDGKSDSKNDDKK